MLTYLTLFFGFNVLIVLLYALIGLIGMFKLPVEPEYREIDPTKEALRTSLMIVLLGLPSQYLLYHGILALNFPLWVFWLQLAIYALNMLRPHIHYAQSPYKRIDKTQSLSGLGFTSIILYIMWVGLNALR